MRIVVFILKVRWLTLPLDVMIVAHTHLSMNATTNHFSEGDKHNEKPH